MRLAEPPMPLEFGLSAWRVGHPDAPPDARQSVRSAWSQPSWSPGRRRRPPTALACRTRPWSTTWRTRGRRRERRRRRSSCRSWRRGCPSGRIAVLSTKAVAPADV